MQRDSVRLKAMMQDAADQGRQPDQVGQVLGRDAMIELAKNCPAAVPLALGLVQTEQGQRAMASQAPKLPPGELKVLQPLAAAMCAELDASNAKKPFRSLTPTGRQQVFMTTLQKVFRLHTVALQRYYGNTQLNKQLSTGELDGKIGAVMSLQHNCGQYLLLIGADQQARPRKP